jgi:hypothetical protein
MKTYADLASLSEDERIDAIGHHVLDHQHTVGFIVEDYAKADRYIEKMQEKFPTIMVLYRGPGPVEGTVVVKVQECPKDVQ